MTRVKVQTLVTLTLPLIGLGGGVFVFLMLEKAPLETLATPEAAGQWLLGPGLEGPRLRK
jgi:hypothetical protein